MGKLTIEKDRKLFIDYCFEKGMEQELFLNENNIEAYAKTAANAFNGYPLLELAFDGNFDEDNFYRMLKVDLKCRIGKAIGIAVEDYKSVLVIEPPLTKKTGDFQYLKTIDLREFGLLIQKPTRKQSTFEGYALKKRKPYLDERTWYIYLFTTEKKHQRLGYGKQLINVVTSFAKEYKYKLCLETNLRDNIPMYEKFGFRVVDDSVYKDCIDHLVMYYD